MVGAHCALWISEWNEGDGVPCFPLALNVSLWNCISLSSIARTVSLSVDNVVHSNVQSLCVCERARALERCFPPRRLCAALLLLITMKIVYNNSPMCHLISISRASESNESRKFPSLFCAPLAAAYRARQLRHHLAEHMRLCVGPLPIRKFENETKNQIDDHTTDEIRTSCCLSPRIQWNQAKKIGTHRGRNIFELHPLHPLHRSILNSTAIISRRHFYFNEGCHKFLVAFAYAPRAKTNREWQFSVTT